MTKAIVEIAIVCFIATCFVVGIVNWVPPSKTKPDEVQARISRLASDSARCAEMGREWIRMDSAHQITHFKITVPPRPDSCRWVYYNRETWYNQVVRDSILYCEGGGR